MKKRKNLIIVLIELLMLLIVIFGYMRVYKLETGKKKYSNDAESFVNANKDPVFKIKQITLISSANAVDNSGGSLKDIDISQFTDISIDIDNTGKSSDITAENTINEMYITNIKKSTMSDPQGKKLKFNYKNPYNNGKFIDIDNYKNDGILFKVFRNNSEYENANFEQPAFYTDCSNPISLGYVNKNFLTGCEVNSDNGSISFDGTILKSAGTDLKSIEPTLGFSINIVNNQNEKFVCNLDLKVDISSNADEEIYTGYVVRVINTDDEKYNFLKISY
ncbi:MAG: hypothetical protein K6D97_01200 [Clostridia bacterium]|nr:hypothetical protein [Clostridia bacterium]